MNVNQTFRTKAEIAILYIQEQILSGKIPADSQITTQKVAKEIGMSETPVREAIKSLSADGWLSHTPHQGTIVVTLNNAHISEIFELRGLLNAQAILRSKSSFNEERLALIDKNIEQSEIAVLENDFETYSTLNRNFHELLCNTPDAEWTYRLFNTLQRRSAVFRHGFKAIPNGLRKSLDAHMAIQKALQSGNIEKAATLANKDEVSAGQSLIDHLNKNDEQSNK